MCKGGRVDLLWVCRLLSASKCPQKSEIVEIAGTRTTCADRNHGARDPAAAAKWSKRAADQGHEKAALMYQALQSSGTESRPQPDPVAEKASSGSGSGIEEYPA